MKKKYSYYPLFDLETDLEQSFELTKGVYIELFNIENFKLDNNSVSKYDKMHLSESLICLKIDESQVCPKEMITYFMICCRLYKHSKFIIRYRIDSNNQVSSVCDDYSHIESDDTTNQINVDEFKKISILINRFIKFSKINKRTHNIAYFLKMAYQANSWLESLIFFVCALETITSASEFEYDITNKFKIRINNFVKHNESKLELIYNTRSELVHGRYDSESDEENLKRLIIAEGITREVCLKILNNNSIIECFKDDDKRCNLFNKENI